MSIYVTKRVMQYIIILKNFLALSIAVPLLERPGTVPTSTDMSSKVAYEIWNTKRQVNDSIALRT
jgi:hypothetical protein